MDLRTYQVHLPSMLTLFPVVKYFYQKISNFPWMDELGFYVPSTVFQSFQDDGRMNMKGSVQ